MTPNQTVNDIDLIHLAIRGDSASLGLLLERYRPRLYATALGILNDVQRADDAVQDTFVIALTRLQSLHTPGAFAGWLFTILWNVCRGYLRATIREVEADDALLDGDAGQVGSTERIEETVEQMLTREDVYRALASLSEPLRAAIMLRYLSSWNRYEDIAVILGLPIGTVRSRLAQAREKLFGQLLNIPLTQTATESPDELGEQFLDSYARLYAGERDWYLNQFASDLRFIFRGEPSTREAFIRDVDEDLTFHNRIHPFRVLTSGNLIVAEGRIESGPDNPFPCPPLGVEVRTMEHGRVVRLHIYLADELPVY
jgi:RNA polymerase sigma-70 factor (ECF subfamily)